MSSSLAGIPKFESKPTQDFDDFDDILSLSSDSDKVSKKSSIKSKKSLNETKMSNISLDKSNFSLAVNAKPTVLDSIKEKKKEGVKSALDSLIDDDFSKDKKTTEPTKQINEFSKDQKAPEPRKQNDDFGSSLFQEASSRRRKAPAKKEEGTDDEMLDILGFGNDKLNTKTESKKSLFGSKAESLGHKKEASFGSKPDHTVGHKKRVSSDIFTNADSLFGSKPADSIFANKTQENLFGSHPPDSIFKQESFNSKKLQDKSNTSIVDKQEREDDIPSFLQDTSSRRRGRGSTKTNDTNSNSLAAQLPKITADNVNFLDLIKADKVTKDLVPSPQKPEPPKLGILDILDKQLPIKPDKPSIANQKLSDVSSIPVLSDTDEASSPIAASFKSNSKKSSLKSKSSFVKETNDPGLLNDLETKLKISMHDIDNLKNDLQAEKIRAQELEAKTKSEAVELENSIKAKHEEEIRQLKKERDNALLKVESVRLEYEHKLSVQEALHKQKLEEYIANNEKSDKLNNLVGKVETTNEQMAQLQSKFNHTYEENLRVRQESIMQKESLLANLQQQLQKESQELEKERQKVGELIEKLEGNIKESTERFEQERINSQKKEKTLQSGMIEFEQTRDSILFSLNQEKAAFANEKHQWEQDRKKLLHKINQDRKELSIQKAQLSSQERRQTQLLEEQSQQLKFNQNQFQAEYQIFEQERQELSTKIIELNKQVLIFNTEKLKLENKEKEVQMAVQVLEQEKLEIVKKLDLITKNRDEAATEKQTNLQILQSIELQKKEMQELRVACQTDLHQFKEKRKEYFNERINWSRKQSFKQRHSQSDPINTSITEQQVKHAWADKPIADIDKDVKTAREINKWSKQERELASELEFKADSYLLKHERVK
ncbi:hypothetical protein HK103_007563 [Boothiomyces macroporosus]|uniref:Fas-binding factor 1 n=1 Tax=Boothiomyces macroporosus TaxID=261099 RepID=A0AAD5UCF0_9FUNG|nr:hypothetical protein HK103_007563 [Boothiomyces macroporosus]